MDGNATQHTYPRPGDPASNSYLSIGSTTNNTFEVNVGKAPTKNYTPSAVTYNPTTGIMEMTIGNHCYETSSTLDPTWAEYDPNTGYMTITVANHGLCNGNRIKLADNAVCEPDMVASLLLLSASSVVSLPAKLEDSEANEPDIVALLLFG